MKSGISLVFRNKVFLSICAVFSIFSLFYGFVLFFPLEQVCFNGACLRVELALTQQKRSQGLMFRKSLPKNRGMLFVFDEDDYWAFWMKNTYIPLDMIWLNADRQVVYIVKGARPARGGHAFQYIPAIPTRYVVEARAGFCKENNIQLGDQAKFKWIFLPKKL